MPHPLTDLRVKAVTSSPQSEATAITADVCVVGAGIAGLSAAIESARLGRRVVLVDSLPVLGGQMVNSLIGLFCGVFGNAPERRQLTHGVFDDIFETLGPSGDLHFNHHHTTTVYYDEIALARWAERTVQALDIQLLLGAVIANVDKDADCIGSIRFATRFGDVEVFATGFVDASGDASLAWEAGFVCQVPERPIYGSQQAIVEQVDDRFRPDPEEFAKRLSATVSHYGLIRRDGLAFFFPGRGTAVLNMTHIEAPLDPLGASQIGLEGRAQVDRVLDYLRTEYPEAFGKAKVRAYGMPGRRQTRWLKGVHQLTADEVREGVRFDDAVARTAWPIELHDRPEGYVWEPFGPDHLHYVPLRSMLSPECRNYVAAGRCVDGDAAALSSVRVMGPCAAMGAAAAHALDLARDASVHDVDIGALRRRLRHNLEFEVTTDLASTVSRAVPSAEVCSAIEEGTSS
ncbi:MAG: FAD-dependent oxidoreductase [Acidimicrobiales bacterium]